MRRLLLLFVCMSASAGEMDLFSERVIRFHNHWNAFVRSYLGCPKGATSADQCHPKIGIVDYAEFTAASREARILFARE